MKWVKRIAIGLVVVFALFYMITRPEDAANAVQGAVGALSRAEITQLVTPHLPEAARNLAT